MSDLSTLTLLDGNIYTIKDAIRGVEFIVGTQKSSTGSWTGVTNRTELFDGMQIKYFLPYAGSGNATLNLTLSGGGTTGAKPVYRYGTTSVTTHYPANSVISLTYSTKAVGTGAWYANADYDSDTKNTAGSTDTSSKLFLIGATSQAANPQTYSDNEVYATDGKLSMKEAQIGGDSGPIVQYNTTTKSLDFVFS